MRYFIMYLYVVVEKLDQEDKASKLNITFEKMLYKESTKGINFITMQIMEVCGLKLICLIFLSLSLVMSSHRYKTSCR
jgi:hypothetical protein